MIECDNFVVLIDQVDIDKYIINGNYKDCEVCGDLTNFPVILKYRPDFYDNFHGTYFTVGKLEFLLYLADEVQWHLQQAQELNNLLEEFI